MANHLTTSLLAASAIALLAGPAPAATSGSGVNPNGFPSGAHYNLNIHGKNADFACPGVGTDPVTGLPVYGNSVFLPENGSAQILMQSGKGNRAASIPELQVTDPCAEAYDGSPAVLQLPKNDLGYRVYARALAKPTDAPWLTVVPDLVAVQDESGYDLIYLGLVTDRGFETATATFQRSGGRSQAVDISGLFHWSGDVCYLAAGAGYDWEQTFCCVDVDGDGLYDSCSTPVDGLCSLGTSPVTTYCNSYNQEWVFNVGDFVTYLWDATNSGLKLLQVRFYPITQ